MLIDPIPVSCPLCGEPKITVVCQDTRDLFVQRNEFWCECSESEHREPCGFAAYKSGIETEQEAIQYWNRVSTRYHALKCPRCGKNHLYLSTHNHLSCYGCGYGIQWEDNEEWIAFFDRFERPPREGEFRCDRCFRVTRAKFRSTTKPGDFCISCCKLIALNHEV